MRSAFLTVAAFMVIPLWTVSSQGVQPKRGDRIRVTVPSLGVKPFVGIVGAVVGLVAGVVTTAVVDPREEWETVPTRRGSRNSLAPSLHIAPSTRGVRLGLRAGF